MPGIGKMELEYEACRTNLESLAAIYASRGGQRNEATTRLQLIDRLFFECLGWSRDEVVLEEPHGREYADYAFYNPRRVLIVEAKKEGNYFELPAGNNRLDLPLPPLLRDHPNLKAAMEQAAGYCQTRGVLFGAVCNGHQIVAFVATRSDGLPPLEGRALVFPSFPSMLGNFLTLWQALSKPGVEEKRLFSLLIGDTRPALPPKLSTGLLRYPGIKGRNVFQTDLQIVSELVFEDLTRARDLEVQFLEECYSQSGALSQYSLTSRAILAARYAALFDVDAPGPTPVPAMGRRGISPELLAESLSRRPVLLLGDVGVGKSTFLRHLIKIDAPEVFEKAITLYLDLGSQAALAAHLREFVPDEIARQLREGYGIDVEERNFVRGVYHGELERFAKGIYADLREANLGLYKEKEIASLAEKVDNKEQHLKAALQHVSSGRKQQIVVFLDNADQREYDTQQRAFLIAQEMAEHWPVTVFVALRPETFHRSVQTGALSGYHAKAFTISPPRIDLVIEKRLRFALKLASGEIPIQALPQDIRTKFSNLEIIIQVFLHSLARNDALKVCIDNICGGNVRLALDLVRSFFGSGHVDTQKIADIYSETGRYYIPLHEFLNAVIFGDAEYYDPDRSVVANLFDVSHADPKEHFLLPLVISLLAAYGNSSSAVGFMDVADLYERLQGLGFMPGQIDHAVTRGVRKKLIETAGRRVPEAGQVMPNALRATTVGLYHIDELCRQFNYVDAMIVDTPIFDPGVRGAVGSARSIGERLNRMDRFRRYLDSQWMALAGVETPFDWCDVSDALRTEQENIRMRVG